ncbi:MAG TPA: winged helix-turn-helix domain-containing protein [Blastocatellia bacterium]|nr:winged helix-turn-helix domain-containing protein [Blastocatellia bacterium]
MTSPAKRVYEFGPFRLDAASRRLLKDGQAVPLQRKTFETLLALVEQSGQVVEKDELLKRLWPDSFVEESNLMVHISTLRKALGESDGGQKYIETIPKRGYRFTAAVRESSGEEAGAALDSPGQRPRAVRKALAVAVIVAVLVATAITAVYFLRPARPQIKSLAVLPFRSLGQEERGGYLGLGLADALITRLSNLSQIVVRPTGAVTRYDGAQSPLAAGRELGVDAVLDGRLQTSGEHLRLTVQLIRTSDGAAIWAETFDEPFTSIFAVQDSISERVAEALSLRLTGADRERLTRRYTENAEAYQLYLQGRYYWNRRTPDGYRRAIEYFEQAIHRDPNDAPAYAGLADCYALLSWSNAPPVQLMPKAREAAQKALAIDDRLVEARTSLAYIKAWYEWDWPAAETAFKQAIEINPNYATTHQWYALYLCVVGRLDEAAREFKRARELDPVSLIIHLEAAFPLYYARRFDEAIEAFRQTLERDADFATAHEFLALCYEQKDRKEAALREALNAWALAGNTESVAAIEQAYARAGYDGALRKWLEKLNEAGAQGYVSPLAVARIYTSLGDNERAFEWLEKAYEARAGGLPFIAIDPRYDRLRADARFINLVRRLGLEAR